MKLLALLLTFVSAQLIDLSELVGGEKNILNDRREAFKKYAKAACFPEFKSLYNECRVELTKVDCKTIVLVKYNKCVNEKYRLKALEYKLTKEAKERDLEEAKETEKPVDPKATGIDAKQLETLLSAIVKQTVAEAKRVALEQSLITRKLVMEEVEKIKESQSLILRLQQQNIENKEDRIKQNAELVRKVEKDFELMKQKSDLAIDEVLEVKEESGKYLNTIAIMNEKFKGKLLHFAEEEEKLAKKFDAFGKASAVTQVDYSEKFYEVAKQFEKIEKESHTFEMKLSENLDRLNDKFVEQSDRFVKFEERLDRKLNSLNDKNKEEMKSDN